MFAKCTIPSPPAAMASAVQGCGHVLCWAVGTQNLAVTLEVAHWPPVFYLGNMGFTLEKWGLPGDTWD